MITNALLFSLNEALYTAFSPKYNENLTGCELFTLSSSEPMLVFVIVPSILMLYNTDTRI